MLESIIGRRKRVKALREELIRINSIKFDFSNQYTEEQNRILNSQKAQLATVYYSVYNMTKGNLDNLSLLSEEDLNLIAKRLNSVTFNYYIDEKYRKMVTFLISAQGKLSQLLVKEPASNLEKYKQKVKNLISKQK